MRRSGRRPATTVVHRAQDRRGHARNRRARIDLREETARGVILLQGLRGGMVQRQPPPDFGPRIVNALDEWSRVVRGRWIGQKMVRPPRGLTLPPPREPHHE